MRKVPLGIRSLSTTRPLLKAPKPPSPKYAQEILNSLSHAKLTKHPQSPLPTRGVGPFTRNAQTGERLTLKQRTEEKAKEYLYEQPDPDIPLPPLLLRPPGLVQPPQKGQGHGKELRRWWQREFEIWFGRYQKPFDVQAQMDRHKTMYGSGRWEGMLMVGTRIIRNGVPRQIDVVCEKPTARYIPSMRWKLRTSFSCHRTHSSEVTRQSMPPISLARVSPPAASWSKQ